MADGDIVLAPDVAFDIGTRRLYSLNGPAGRADRLDVISGDNPLLWKFLQNFDDAQLPAHSVIRFAVQPYFDVSIADLAAPASLASIGENWSAAPLLALFTANQKFVDLIGLFSVKVNGDTRPRFARPFGVRFYNADYIADAPGVSGTGVLQTKPFTALTGGAAGSLDGVPTTGLAVDTWIARVIINTGGARASSEWELVAGNDAEDPDAGIVRPDDYAAVTNEKVWVRLD